MAISNYKLLPDKKLDKIYTKMRVKPDVPNWIQALPDEL